MGRKIGEGNYEVLRILRHAAVNNEGWKWRGRRGWMFSNEFPHNLRLASSYLPQLAKIGLVDRSDVSDPFRTQPVVLYRINTAGLGILAEYEQIQGMTQAEADLLPPLDQLSPEEEDALFLSTNKWLGLAYMQRRGTWCLPREVARGIQPNPFYAGDAEFLVRRKLLKQDRTEEGWRIFRVTTLGLGARVLDDKTSPDVVQLHAPGLRAAAEIVAHTPGPLPPQRVARNNLSGG